MINTQFVDRKIFGNKESKQAHCILVCSHDNDGQEFLLGCPELLESIEVERSVFDTYMKIEQDVGSSEITFLLAEKIAKKLPELRIDVLDVTIPRSIIDSNRINPEKGIRKIFDFSKNTHLYGMFIEIQTSITSTIKEMFTDLHPQGFFIDIHSMAPFDPNKSEMVTETEAVQETPHGLQKYIESYTKPENRGRRRYINLINTYKGVTIVDQRLVTEIENFFNESGYKTRVDHPYEFSAHVMSKFYCDNYRGCVIDFPKDFFSKISVEDEKFDLANIQISDEKIEDIASVFSQAVENFAQKHIKIS